ncbi:MAG: polyisoprenoid-binding protein [Bacteroidetes bacterium]|nr:MAG: polyisoprenoid-binding protein [Bacteroidota bacterium]
MTKEKTRWVIDPAHSEFSFRVKHMMISTVTGQFESFSSTAESEGDGFTDASVRVEIDVASINTRDEKRDAHLKSDDFFNAESYPKITFRSKRFDGRKLMGDITIRETTKEITLDTEFNGIAVDLYGQTKAGFELTGELDRKEFGLRWDAVTDAGNVVAGDRVILQIGAQFIRQE